MARHVLMATAVILGVAVVTMAPTAAFTAGVLTSDTYQAGAGCTVNFDTDATTLLSTYGPLSSFTYRNGCWMDAVTMSYGSTYDAAATVTYGGIGGSPGDVFTIGIGDPIVSVDVGAVNGNGFDYVQWVRFTTQSGSTLTTSSTGGCFIVGDPVASFSAPTGQALLALGGCSYAPDETNSYISGLTFFWGVRWTDIGLSGEDEGVPVTLPFDFPFYCWRYAQGGQAYVSTNGFITFSLDDTRIYNPAYFDQAVTGQVAPYWLDLYIPPGVGGKGVLVRTRKDGRGGKPSALVVWWRNVQTSVYLQNDVANINFQAWLLPGGTVLMGYVGMPVAGQTLPATAGDIPAWSDQQYSGASPKVFSFDGSNTFNPSKCFISSPDWTSSGPDGCPVTQYTGREVPYPCEKAYQDIIAQRANPKYKYLGCYRDTRASRAFPNKAWDRKLTVPGCARFAVDPPASYQDQTVKPTQPAKYFGVQFGRECWIDNNELASIKRHGALPESDCNMACGGDKATKCGGNYAFKLYELVA